MCHHLHNTKELRIGGGAKKLWVVSIITSTTRLLTKPVLRNQRNERCLIDVPITNIITTTNSSSARGAPLLYILNATSLAKQVAIQQLNEDVIDTAADIVIITETWFKPQQSEDLFSLQGFAGIQKDRCKRKGGGVLVREFYHRSDQSGNKFLTKKFLHQCAYKGV